MTCKILPSNLEMTRGHSGTTVSDIFQARHRPIRHDIGRGGVKMVQCSSAQPMDAGLWRLDSLSDVK